MRRVMHVGSILVLGTYPMSLLAQTAIVTDGSVGPTLALSGSNVEIGTDLGRILGANLFHSFADFRISAGDSATFSGPASIDNIVARITGNTSSDISGTLASSIDTANLWLINPNGIRFGTDARLDVDGAFHASTASEVRLADGAIFPADIGTPLSLSVAAPVSFGFAPDNVGGIALHATNLQPRAGSDLSLVANRVDVVREPDAPTSASPSIRITDGRLIVAGVASGDSFTPSQPSRTEAGGAISLRNRARIEATGAQASVELVSSDILLRDRSQINVINDSTQDAQGGFSIVAANLTMNNARISAQTIGAGDGAQLAIDLSGDLLVDNDARIRTETTPNIDDFGTGPNGLPIIPQTGDAGDIVIGAQNVTLGYRSRIVALASGSGDTGAIDLRAEGQLTMAGARILATNLELRRGLDGEIPNGDYLAVDDGSGRIAQVDVNETRAQLLPSGRSGDIRVASGSFQLRSETPQIDGVRLPTSTSLVQTETNGPGRAGNIDVDVAGEFHMETFDPNDAENFRIDGGVRFGTPELQRLLDTGARGTVASFGDGAFSGAPGNIAVTAERLEIIGRGRIFTRSEAQNTTSVEPGGNIDVDVDELVINEFGEGIIARTAGALPSGDIDISSGTIDIAGTFDDLDVVRNADGTRSRFNGLEGIRSDADGSSTGKAGDVSIAVDRLTMSSDARLVSVAQGAGDAGDITINGRGGPETRADSVFLSVLPEDYRQSDLGISSRVGTQIAARSNNGAQIVQREDGSVRVPDAGSVVIRAERIDNVNALVSAQALVRGNEIVPVVPNDAERETSQVLIDAQTVNLLGGNIRASTFGADDANDIVVNVDRRLTISSSREFTDADYSDTRKVGLQRTHGISSVARLGSSGDAGDIIINAGEFFASTQAEFNDQIDSVDDVSVSTLITSASESVGRAGAITVDVAGRLDLSGLGTVIQSSSTGTGLAGDVDIAAQTLELKNSTISTSGATDAGGRINIEIDERSTLVGSRITTSGIVPAEGASLLTLTSPLVVANDTQILALTGDDGGNGLIDTGRVSITSDQTVLSLDTTVAAGNQVTIQGLDSEVGSDVVVPEALPTPTPQVGQPCAFSTPGASTINARLIRTLEPAPNLTLPVADRLQTQTAAC